MPLTLSAIKRARQNVVRHQRLLPYKTNMKTMMRKFGDLVKEGKRNDAEKLLPQVYKAIDTAAKKRLIHTKNAAHKKSLVARSLAAASRK